MVPNTNRYDIPIDGHKLVALAFNEHMDGVPAVFMHGIMASVDFWAAGQTPIFADGMRWYSLSLPGHYPAAFPPGFHREALTAAMMARVLTAAIRELVGDGPAILIGHSTGGFAALNVAAHAPEIAHGVVSVSGFARGRWTGPLARLQRLARQDAIGEALFKTSLKAFSLSRAVYRAVIGSCAADRPALMNGSDFEPTLDLLYLNAKRLDGDAMAHYFNRMPDIDISDLLPRITAPTLVLAGDCDPVVPPAQARLIAERVPRGELVMLEGVGHLPMGERPAAYHRIITEWVERTTQEEMAYDPGSEMDRL